MKSNCRGIHKAVTDGRKSKDDIIRFNDLNVEAFEDIILSKCRSHKEIRKSCS